MDIRLLDFDDNDVLNIILRQNDKVGRENYINVYEIRLINDDNENDISGE